MRPTPLLRTVLPLALGAAAWVGCRGPARVVPPPPPVARMVVELERFEVCHEGEVVGLVRHLEIPDPAGPVRYWCVETPSGSLLGHASEQGRFSRRVPFRDDEEDMGVWPMRRGVARLLDLDGPVELRAIPDPEPRSGAQPASAHKR